MSAPLITIYDSTDANIVTSWNVGDIKAQTPTTPLTINIWNNKAGATDVSDLKDCEIMILDDNGSTYDSDVPKYKWVQVNCNAVDGDTSTYTAIGGSDTKKIKANGGVGDEFCIKGTTNNGSASSFPENVSTVRLRMEAPINSTPGNKTFKVRILGYYT